MENIETFFKESGHQERNFPLDESGWNRLDAALGRKRKKRWLPFWVGLLGLTLAVGVIGYRVGVGASVEETKQATMQTPRDEMEAQMIEKTAATSIISSLTEINDTTFFKDSRIFSHFSNQEDGGYSGVNADAISRGGIGGEQALDGEISPGILGKSLPPLQKRIRLAPLKPLKEKLTTATADFILRTQAIARNPEAGTYSETNNNRLLEGNNMVTSKPALLTLALADEVGTSILGEEIKGWQRENGSKKWQLGLRYSIFPKRPTDNFVYYVSDTRPGQYDSFHQFDSGTFVELYTAGTVPYHKNLDITTIGLTLYRDVGNGVKLNGGVLMTSDHSEIPPSVLGEIPQGSAIIYFTNATKWETWSVALGLDYTLFRRQRFQPFIGFVVFKSFSQQFKYESYIHWPAMNISELGSVFKTKHYENLQVSILVNGGVQFYIIPKWSLGLTFDLLGENTNASNRLGFGLETRYRW
ncbi:MAG: hypothetical protein R2828_21020 [Saprospiraceae bacterium]